MDTNGATWHLSRTENIAVIDHQSLRERFCSEDGQEMWPYPGDVKQNLEDLGLAKMRGVQSGVQVVGDAR